VTVKVSHNDTVTVTAPVTVTVTVNTVAVNVCVVDIENLFYVCLVGLYFRSGPSLLLLVIRTRSYR